MKILAFSPTGRTLEAAEAVAKGFDGLEPDVVDLLTVAEGTAIHDETVLFAVPAFAGRVPAFAAEKISEFKGEDGAAAVVLVSYGGRAYDDALLELSDLARADGFRVLAGVAALTEHSMARSVCHGRPDEDDLGKLEDFGQRIREKQSCDGWKEAPVPGNRPYRPGLSGGPVPVPLEGCVSCGACASACPVGAIDSSDPSAVDSSKCISCLRCTSVCPLGVRDLTTERKEATLLFLHKAGADGPGKEPELFL